MAKRMKYTFLLILLGFTFSCSNKISSNKTKEPKIKFDLKLNAFEQKEEIIFFEDDHPREERGLGGFRLHGKSVGRMRAPRYQLDSKALLGNSELYCSIS